jgi:hypothetical protein
MALESESESESEAESWARVRGVRMVRRRVRGFLKCIFVVVEKLIGLIDGRGWVVIDIGGLQVDIKKAE